MYPDYNLKWSKGSVDSKKSAVVGHILLSALDVVKTVHCNTLSVYYYSNIPNSIFMINNGHFLLLNNIILKQT